jgi:outer membrane protein TolC
MAAAWQAARARYPQVTALDDPMVAVTVGPSSFGSNTVNPAYRLEISQKYPFPGKRALRGQSALAEARAAGNEALDTRLQLVENTLSAFADYYLADRAGAVNADNLRLLTEFRRTARDRYRRVPGANQQDVLQADVEIARQQERGLTLERMRRVAAARINTLLNLPPDLPLPPPPREVHLGEKLPEVRGLRAAALDRRPDLRALADRIAAEQAALALACKESYPDLEPFVMYDRFMGNNSQSEDLALMVGVRLNLPVRTTRRCAAVAEAQARLAQRRAELARLTSRVNFQVQEAYEQLRESRRVLALYRGKILPAARANVEAARSAYQTGRIPFLSLLEAQRGLVGLRDRYYEAVAEAFRRQAALERASGGPLLPP